MKDMCIRTQFHNLFLILLGRDSVVGIATTYGLIVRGSSPHGDEVSESIQTEPEAHSDSYAVSNGYFPAAERPESGVDHPPLSSTEAKERVELYICSPSRTSRPVSGRILLFILMLFYQVA
jgi:hypothetical protein